MNDKINCQSTIVSNWLPRITETCDFELLTEGLVYCNGEAKTIYLAPIEAIQRMLIYEGGK